MVVQGEPTRLLPNRIEVSKVGDIDSFQQFFGKGVKSIVNTTKMFGGMCVVSDMYLTHCYVYIICLYMLSKIQYKVHR